METVFFSKNIDEQSVIAFIYKSVFVDDAFVFSNRVKSAIEMKDSLVRIGIVFFQFKIDNYFFGELLL